MAIPVKHDPHTEREESGTEDKVIFCATIINNAYKDAKVSSDVLIAFFKLEYVMTKLQKATYTYMIIFTALLFLTT